MTFVHIFLSMFFVIGFVLLGKGICSYCQGAISLRWPQTQASINSCDIEKLSFSDDTTWEVKVDYVYEVSGKKYEGKRIAYGYSGSSDKEDHQAIYKKVKNAQSIFVRYNPNNPNESVIAAGFNLSIFLDLVFAITWVLFITGFSIGLIMSKSKDSRILEHINVVENKSEQPVTQY